MSNLAKGRARIPLPGAAASPIIEATVLLPHIDLRKGLPQACPRRGIAVLLLLSVNLVHRVEKRQSMGVVEGMLMSLLGACTVHRGLCEKAATDAQLYSAIASRSRQHGRRALLSIIFASSLVLSFSKV
jgi:hypothetical protein